MEINFDVASFIKFIRMIRVHHWHHAFRIFDKWDRETQIVVSGLMQQQLGSVELAEEFLLEFTIWEGKKGLSP